MSNAAQIAGLEQTVRTPSFEIVCGWIAAAWKEIPKDTIIRSFRCCGLTTALDGSEDDQLHCFKLPDLRDGPRLLAEARINSEVENSDILASNEPTDIFHVQPEDVPDIFTEEDPRDDDILVHNLLDLDLGSQVEF